MNELLETTHLNGHAPRIDLSNSVADSDDPLALLPALLMVTPNIAPSFDSMVGSLKAQLATIDHAINLWEKMAPQLYQMRKKLQLCEEVLSGKRKVESVTASEPARDPVSGKSRTFVKQKSEIITDAVLDEIVKYIESDQEYHKAKDIYCYLRERDLVPHLHSPTSFSHMLARVDQDKIVYNNHYSIAAWGLPDFGTPEHARRKALLAEDNRVTSFGKG